ncbi:MAG: TlpA family protein disulfide reductase [Flavobacteriales bacterium]|nr:TlpA family protein disulfide reductase [Flavobacteriales bacterium]MDW8409123.1 TlpA disulfide reductase family protein [Flavobacteriales bacterium]
MKGIVNSTFPFRILRFGLCFWILWAFSCQRLPAGEPFLIGKVENFNGKHVFLEKIFPDKILLIDSAVVNDTGGFFFYKKPDQYGHYRIRFGGTAGTARLAPYQNLIFLITSGNEKLRLSTKAPDFVLRCNLEGSPESQALLALLQRKLRHERLGDSLRTALNTFTYAPDFPQRARVADSLFYYSEQSLKALARQTAEFNPSSLVALEGLGFLKMEEDFPLFKKVSEALKQKHPDNPYVKMLVSNVEVRARTAIGAVAPDIRLPDPQGKIRSLHSLRGKYVLLDFWASWCRPCRAENPNLVHAYQKYKEKGFDIFQVSLDRDKNAWIQAIQNDGLSNWHHVSDLKMWDSEPAKLYNVTGIPKSFLLDPNGVIVATDLRGPALEAKLAEIFR